MAPSTPLGRDRRGQGLAHLGGRSPDGGGDNPGDHVAAAIETVRGSKSAQPAVRLAFRWEYNERGCISSSSPFPN